MRRLTPKPNELLTMKDLLLSGLFTNPMDGVKILGKVNINRNYIHSVLPYWQFFIKGKENFKVPIHLEVSRASEDAIQAVEAAGGTITCVHFNKLALRALLKPYKFDILPRRARPPPKLMNYYLDRTKAGYLSPEVQMRNLKLFGAVTSEEKLREEHEFIRQYLRAEKVRQDALLLKTQEESSSDKTVGARI